MKFTETPLKNAFVIEPERFEDERGFFSQSWSQREFAKRDLNADLVECNISFNAKKGTLRGLHFQEAPHVQTKLVRCTMGAIYDVIVDLRIGSHTFARWFAVELTADNRRQLYVPKGCAHGFQTLQDSSEVFYQMSDYFAPETAHGVRWDDPAFRIEWPSVSERIINSRDRQYPDFTL